MYILLCGFSEDDMSPHRGICPFVLFSLVNIIPSLAEQNDIGQALSDELVDSWHFDLKPRYSKVAIQHIEDVLNPFPFQLEYVMTAEEFETFGALFRYSLICGDADRARTLSLEHTMYQTTNDQNWLYKTRISQFSIPWNTLTGARADDFVSSRCHHLIPLPSAGSSTQSIAFFEDALVISSPSEPIVFMTMLSFFLTEDYGDTRSPNTTSCVIS